MNQSERHLVMELIILNLILSYADSSKLIPCSRLEKTHQIMLTEVCSRKSLFRNIKNLATKNGARKTNMEIGGFAQKSSFQQSNEWKESMFERQRKKTCFMKQR